MTFEVTFLELAGLALTLLGGFWGLAKMLINTTSMHLDERFDRLQDNLDDMHTAQSKAADDMHRIDRDVMLLRAELPEKYVRREDHNKDVAMVLVRMDSMSLKLDHYFLKERANG